MRYWKDRLLYQIRRFRELVGRSLHLGAKAFTEESIPDDVERETWHVNKAGSRFQLEGSYEGWVFFYEPGPPKYPKQWPSAQRKR